MFTPLLGVLLMQLVVTREGYREAGTTFADLTREMPPNAGHEKQGDQP
jgi:hypothetical protein